MLSDITEFTLNDIGLRIYHPEIHLTRDLNINLMTRLAHIYNSQSQKADQLSFSSTEKKIATLSPGMVTLSDIFDEDTPGIINRLFETLNIIVTTAKLPGINTYDLVISSIYRPKITFAESSILGHFDFIGRHFLKSIDFSPLGAEDRSTGINWTYQRGDQSYTLKIEPFLSHPDEIFMDLVVQFPEEQISILEMKNSVESEIKYFSVDVLGFLKTRSSQA